MDLYQMVFMGMILVEMYYDHFNCMIAYSVNHSTHHQFFSTDNYYVCSWKIEQKSEKCFPGSTHVQIQDLSHFPA